MKQSAQTLILMVLILVLAASCNTGLSLVKNDVDQVLPAILADLEDGGERLKREVTGRTGYSWEKWLIRDRDGNLHVVIVENGAIEAIDPVRTAEEFTRYKPFGGWRKK